MSDDNPVHFKSLETETWTKFSAVCQQQENIVSNTETICATVRFSLISIDSVIVFSRENVFLFSFFFAFLLTKEHL